MRARVGVHSRPLNDSQPAEETDVAARIASETLSLGARSGSPHDAICLREAFSLTSDVELGRQFSDRLISEARQHLEFSPARARRCLDEYAAAIASGVPASEAEDIEDLRRVVAEVDAESAGCLADRVR